MHPDGLLDTWINSIQADSDKEYKYDDSSNTNTTSIQNSTLQGIPITATSASTTVSIPIGNLNSGTYFSSSPVAMTGSVGNPVVWNSPFVSTSFVYEYDLCMLVKPKDCIALCSHCHSQIGKENLVALDKCPVCGCSFSGIKAFSDFDGQGMKKFHEYCKNEDNVHASM